MAQLHTPISPKAIQALQNPEMTGITGVQEVTATSVQAVTATSQKIKAAHGGKKKKKERPETSGEKLFDWVVYGFVNYVVNILLSLAITDVLRFGKDSWVTRHGKGNFMQRMRGWAERSKDGFHRFETSSVNKISDWAARKNLPFSKALIQRGAKDFFDILTLSKVETH